MKKKKIEINEYGMNFLEHSNKVLLQDQYSDKILASEPMDHPIDRLKVDAYNEFTILDSNGESSTVKIGLLEEFSKIETGAEYILKDFKQSVT